MMMVKPIVKERRFWPRAQRVMSIEFRLARRKGQISKGPWCLSTTQDLSLGGLSFYTDQELRVHDILEFSLTMSGIVDILRGFTKVVRVERKEMGAYFLVAVKLIENKPKRKIRNLKSSPSTKRPNLKARKRSRI